MMAADVGMERRLVWWDNGRKDGVCAKKMADGVWWGGYEESGGQGDLATVYHLDLKLECT